MSAARLTRAAIKIPKRIERGPTDILRALASTVKHVPSEPSPVLIDDTYLLPIRPSDKSMYMLSRLTGKNTARFILNKHPELFFRDDAEPKVEAFLPSEEFRMDMDLNEVDLKWCIEQLDPVNGVIAYKSLEERGVKLSNDTLLDFFELICYSNEEKMSNLVDFQKHFLLRDSDRDLVDLTWKKGGFISKLFNQIKDETDPPRVYSAMIAGLSKYNEHADAKQVFEDFKQNHSDEGLYLEAYEGLITSIPNLNSSAASVYEAIDELVAHMEQHLVKPSLGVFNSILDCYRKFNCTEETCQKALQLVNDIRSLDMEPSLFTYSCLFSVICRVRSARQYLSMIPGLLDYILANESVLVVRDPRDVQFLPTCMRMFASRLNNLALANKLNKIYIKRPGLFPTNHSKGAYLDHYFKLIIATENLETIMNFYDNNVPMNFRPSYETFDAMAEALDLYQADESLVNRIGADLMTFKMGGRIKNDAIFRKDPKYVSALEEALNKQ